MSGAQERTSVGEQEVLAVLYAVQKTYFYLRGAKKILVHSDNKNLVDYFKMPLTEIKNECILKFRDKLLGYQIKMIHVKGLTHTLADHLSRYPNKKNTFNDLEDRFTRMIASRSLRCEESGFTTEDPHIRKIPRIGK